MDYKEISAQRLKELRKKAGLSQGSLSIATQTLSVSRISNYEQAARMMSVSIAVELASILNTTPAYLLGLPLEHTEEEEQLLAYYRKNTPSRQRTIFEVAEIGAQLGKNR